MQYVFILALGYQPYKKNAEVEIRLNDTLIKTKTLDKPIGFYKIKYQQTANPLDYYPKKLRKNNFATSIFDLQTLERNQQAKVYDDIETITQSFIHVEFDSTVFKEKNVINISVKNDDNNYTNGFITKWAPVRLWMAALVPKSVLDDYGFMQKIRLRLGHKSHYDKNKKPTMTPAGIVYEDIKKDFWPMNLNKLSIKYHNKKNTAPSRTHHPNAIVEYTIGGSFDVKLPIRKKHGIYMIADKHTKGFFNYSRGIDAFAHIYRGGKFEKVSDLMPCEVHPENLVLVDGK